MSAKPRPDRRAQRTRRQLSGAINELIKEKRFDDITVQNVIDRADVGRSTFYSHFRDKEDLFAQQWEGMIDFLAQKIDWSKTGRGSFIPVAFFSDHLKDVQPFYRGLVRSGKLDSLFKTGVERFSQKIESALKTRIKHQPAVPISILSNHLATEFFGLLKWWLDAGLPYTPERMDEIYHELVIPT